MSHDLNFHHLRYFWMVARLGSMTAAANQLGVRVQTLSSQVALLEKALGRSLFQPQGRGLVLTEAGRVALRYADQIFQLGDQLSDSLHDDALDHTLRLSVGIADALPKALTFQTLQGILALPQQVRMVFREGRFEELCTELVQHRIDLVLAERPVAVTSLHLKVVSLLSYPVRVFAKAQRTLSMSADFPRNLHQQPFLLPARNNALRPKLEHWFESNGIAPIVVGEFEDLALLEAFGRGGMGVFVMPCQTIEDVVHGQSDMLYLGDAQGVCEEFYAFAHPRSLNHPALRLIFNKPEQNTECAVCQE